MYLEAIIYLLAGLGVLLVGFKLLSDNIEKLANSGLKKMFNRTSGNRFVGVGIGAAATALIQSSFCNNSYGCRVCKCRNYDIIPSNCNDYGC